MPMFSSPFRFDALLALSAACLMSSCQSKYVTPPSVAMQSSWSQELRSSPASDITSPFQDETLQLLLEVAKTSSPDLKMAMAQIDMARHYYLSKKSALLPQIQASTSASYNHLSKNTINGGAIPPDFSSNLFDVSFQTIWELDFLGKHALARNAAEASLQAASEKSLSVWLALKADICRTYFLWIASQLKIQLAKEMIATYESKYALVSQRVSHKIASPSQAQGVLAELAQKQAQLPLLILQSDINQHTLELLIGKAPGFLKEILKEPSALPNYPYSLNLGIPTDLLKRRPDIRAAERQLASAANLTQAAQLDIFPSFTLTGALGQQSMFAQDLSKSSSHYWSLTPGVQLPIFNAGLLKANYHLSQARQEQAIADYEKCVLQALIEVENALSGINQLSIQENHLQVAMQAQAHILKTQMAKYEQKIIDWIDVLQTQSDYLQSQSAWVDARVNYLNQILFLEKALGGELLSQKKETSKS